MKGNLGPLFWCFLCLLSNAHAASGSCPEAFSKLLKKSTFPLFAGLAREHGIGEELLERAAPQSFEFRREGFPTGGEEGAKVFEMGDYIYDMRKIKLTRPFEMQATMVTQLQYLLMMGKNPSRFVDGRKRVELASSGTIIHPNRPVEMVSWWEAQAFIQKLNRLQDDYLYALPTSAEWEFAARGGTDTRYWFGDDKREMVSYAWFKKNSGGRTHSVAQLPANPLGLYDIVGNAWEWTENWFGVIRLQDVIDPIGPDFGRERIFRGGAWDSISRELRSGNYNYLKPDAKYDNIGFRLIRRPKNLSQNPFR